MDEPNEPTQEEVTTAQALSDEAEAIAAFIGNRVDAKIAAGAAMGSTLRLVGASAVATGIVYFKLAGLPPEAARAAFEGVLEDVYGS